QQPKAAADAWQAALVIDPANAAALRGLANARIQAGDAAAAIAPLQAAARLRPDWRIETSLGVANDMLADHAAAQAAYRTGLNLAPGNLQLTSNLGLSLGRCCRRPPTVPTPPSASARTWLWPMAWRATTTRPPASSRRIS